MAHGAHVAHGPQGADGDQWTYGANGNQGAHVSELVSPCFRVEKWVLKLLH